MVCGIFNPIYIYISGRLGDYPDVDLRRGGGGGVEMNTTAYMKWACINNQMGYTQLGFQICLKALQKRLLVYVTGYRSKFECMKKFTMVNDMIPKHD